MLMPTNSFARFSAVPATVETDANGVVIVDAIVSAGADVDRGSWIERLPADPAVWTLPATAPLLDNHRNGSVRDVIGEAAEFRFEGGQLHARLRITDSAIAEQVKRGTPLKVSFGYRHLKRRNTTENGRRVEIVTAARLDEVSLVIHPADPAAQLRSQAVPNTLEQTEAQQTRAAIRDIARRAGLTAEWADAQIDADATVDQAKAAAFDAQATTRTAPIIRASVGPSNDDPAVIAGRMVEAIAAEAAGVPVEDQGANQYRGLSFARMAEVTIADVPGVRFMGEAAILDAAFSRSVGMLNTHDFAAIALGAGNRIVGHAYREAASPIETKLVISGTAPDFRPVTEVTRFGVQNLKPLTENGEIQAVGTLDAATSWKIGTYAGRIDVTRTLLLNDDKGLFGTLAADLGRAARRTETQAIVNLLATGNGPTMADGEPLFDAEHGNLAAVGAYIADDSLKAAIVAMQAQRSGGGEIIGIAPAYLVVSPELQFDAAALLATVAATKVADVNALSGALELIVDPRLTGGAWYVFAKPTQAPVLKVAHLAGQSGPVVQQQERWSGLGTSFRVFTDFGVTAVDWRGAYRNPGAPA